MNLRRRVRGRDFVVQRLKRLPSIISKLERLPRIRLSQMQDIGGCRAVLRTSDHAYDLALDFASSRIRHKLIRYQDYIENPRRSGYRSLHMMYAYDSDRSTQLEWPEHRNPNPFPVTTPMGDSRRNCRHVHAERPQVEPRRCDLATLLRADEYGDRHAGRNARYPGHANRPKQTRARDQGMRPRSWNL